MIITLSGFIFFISKWTKSPHYLRQRIKDRESEIDDWKHKYKKIAMKYYHMQKGEIVDPQMAENITKSTNPADAIPSLLNSAADHLPKGLGVIAKNPNIQNWLKDLAKKYPNEAKELLGKYLPQMTQIATKTEQTPQMSRL
jgi:hypothetical protein